MNGATLLTIVGRACGLRPTGSRGQTGHERQHVGPDPLHLWFPRPAACCLEGERAREVGGSQENREAKSHVVVSVLASEIEKYIKLEPHESQGPAPIPLSWLPPPSLSRRLLLSWSPHETWRTQALPPKFSSPFCPCSVGEKRSIFPPACPGITVLQGTEVSSVSPQHGTIPSLS